MLLAHKEYRYWRMHGWHLLGDEQWTFARALKMAWAIEKQRAVFAAQAARMAA